MTKRIRIENADTNTTVKVVVEVWDKFEGQAPMLDRVITLSNPTDMTPSDIYLTKNRYLVVKEAE
jgi:hypothetical protein